MLGLLTTILGGWMVGGWVDVGFCKIKANSAQLSWSWGWAWQYLCPDVNFYLDNDMGQAGAELCQTQCKLMLVRLWKYTFSNRWSPLNMYCCPCVVVCGVCVITKSVTSLWLVDNRNITSSRRSQRWMSSSKEIYLLQQENTTNNEGWTGLCHTLT